MVGRHRRTGKCALVRFVDPPWNEEHPQWRELDRQISPNHLAREVVAALQHRLINQQQLTERLEKLAATCAVDGRWEPPIDVPAWMAKVPETRAAQRRR